MKTSISKTRLEWFEFGMFVFGEELDLWPKELKDIFKKFTKEEMETLKVGFLIFHKQKPNWAKD